jgi:hypothetical protein
MEMKAGCIALIIFSGMVTGWAKEMSISQTIASLNADAQKPGGEERVLKSISAGTHVPAATLAKEKASSSLSLGDLYVAHALANAAGKNFNDIVKLKKQGQSWDKIADDNNVSLGGKKVQKMAAAKASPTPAMRGPSNPANNSPSNYKMSGSP